MSLKILHVIPSLHARHGGPSHVVVEMVQAQNQAGIQADIATTHQKNETLDKKDLSGGNLFSFRSCLGTYQYSYELKLWLDRHIQKYHLLHIHSVFCYATLAAARAAEQRKTPYILRPLGQLYPWSIQNRSSLLKRIYLKMFEMRSIRKAAAIHFTTEHEEQHWGLKMPRPASYVLPLGVRQFEPFSQARVDALYPQFRSKKILLSLSRLHPKKGLHLLIPWVSRFLKEERDWILVIAGNGDSSYLRELKRLAKEHGVDASIFFLGAITGDRKRALFQSSRIFILPSQSENFGIAIVEAMTAGIPVLISDQVGIAQEIEKSKSGLVFSLNQESLMRGLLALACSPELQSQLSGHGKSYARASYSWDRITQKQILLYQQIISEKLTLVP